MCRMAMLRFEARAVDTAFEVFDALVQASKFDPYLSKIAGDGRHCHGHGFASAVRRKGGWMLIHERYDAEPNLSGEEACEANLDALEEAVKRLQTIVNGCEECLVMLHSRRTRGEPRGVHGAHPFKEETMFKVGDMLTRAELLLCHNGGVDKNQIAEELKMDFAKLYTDSHVYLKWLATKLAGASIENLPSLLSQYVGQSKRFVKSALDLGLMVFPQGLEPRLFSVGYVVDLEEKRWGYYEPVIIEGDGIVGYVSSTVRDVLMKKNVALEFIGERNFMLTELTLPKPSYVPI